MKAHLCQKIFAVIVVLIAVTHGQLALADERPEVVIGAVLPLSGAAPAFGTEAKLGLEHALAGTPNTRFRYKLILEDDHLEPSRAATAARKLVSLNKAQVLFSNWSYGGMAVASAIRSTPVVNLAFAWDVAILKHGKNNFLIAPDPVAMARMIADRMATEKVKSVALIHLQESGSLYAFGALTELLRGKGIRVVADHELAFDDLAGVRVVWNKVAAQRPDYMVIGLTLPLQLELFKSMKQYGGKGVKVASIGQTPTDAQLKPYLPVVWWGADYGPDKSTLELLRTRTGLQTFAGYSAYYDGMRLLLTAIESGKYQDPRKPTMHELLASLHNARLSDGVLGEVSFQNRIFTSSRAKFVDYLGIVR